MLNSLDEFVLFRAIAKNNIFVLVNIKHFI